MKCTHFVCSQAYSFCLLNHRRARSYLPGQWGFSLTPGSETLPIKKRTGWGVEGERRVERSQSWCCHWNVYTTSMKLSGKDTPRLCVWPFGSNSDGHYCLSERDICCRRGNTLCGCHGNRQSLHFLFLNICSSATSAVQTLRKKNSLIIINTTERRVCGVTSFLVVGGRCAASKVKHTGAVTLLLFICSCKRTVEEKKTRFGFPTLRAATHSHPKLIKYGSVVSGLGPIGPSNSLHTMTDYDFWKVIN